MFYRAAHAGAALLFMVAAVPCLASPLSAGGPAKHRSHAVVAVKSPVATGYNVLVVKYPGGKFEKWGETEWREYANGGQFNFVEQARGETTVMLFDPSRNVYIELNLADGEIRYGEAGQQFSFLYPITETLISDQPGDAAPVEETGAAAAAQRIDYTCEEGLPMSVLYEQVGTLAWQPTRSTVHPRCCFDRFRPVLAPLTQMEPTRSSPKGVRRFWKLQQA